MAGAPAAAARQSPIAVRLSVALAAAVFVVSCANLGSPPGGPVRTEPPIVKSTTPDSGAVNVDPRATITFEFDAQVGDRGIEDLFIISPRDGEPRVRWRRNRIDVRPGRPMRPNTAYAITLLPGITDLNNNRMTAGRTVVVSTGPTIPRLVIQGRVFDWVSARVAPNARIEAMRLPDSLPYVGVADSSGQFVLGPLDDGTYLVRAMIDNNRNRVADPNEPWDSTQVIVRGGSPVLEMLAITRDTLPPRLLTASARDSVSITATFDRPLEPGQPFASIFRVQRQDSTPLRIARVLTRAERDSIQRARLDSADSTRQQPANPLVQALENRLPGQNRAPGDIRPTRPAPPQELTIMLDAATPMAAGASYRVGATAVRAVNGRTGSSDRVIQFTPIRADSVPPQRPPHE